MLRNYNRVKERGTTGSQRPIDRKNAEVNHRSHVTNNLARDQKEILKKKRKRLEDGNPSMLGSMASLIITYWNQGQWTEAEKLEVQVIETKKTVLGPEHPDILANMANLTLTYRN